MADLRTSYKADIDGLVQETRNSCVVATELHLPCI